ncbi:MAG TPA: acyl-CoA dehydrogenase, partial [Propionibacteriaceae bacterium]|nr:acyl-CoA dehydrogenase [Propionibacteriaceae bacterium]
LFGGAIVNLGTAWHHETFLPDAIPGRLLGCFAMTELGHGSDVSSIETTITWLPESGEFEITSPTPGSRKAYIGNAGRDGRMAVVFGQLYVGERSEGVHAVLVPIRDAHGVDLPGVTTGDQGHKGGLLGVDNGTLWFDHVRVPRRMLLDRYGGVGEDGVYHSPIDSPSARFFTMLGTLVRGRICVAGGAASATRRALSVATRYALTRTQFRLPGLGGEIPLLDYEAHQRKLLPNIARAYAYGFAQNEVALELQRVYDQTVAGEVEPERARALETRAAGMKALLTRWANDTVQVCREACGGAGYLSENGLTLTRSDVDVFATFEGDNTVLLQLVAKALLLDYKKSWGEMDLRGTAQATARLMGGAFAERTASRTVITRLVETAHRTPESQLLTTRGWHLEMFEDRERHTVAGLARRMRAAARLPKDEAFAAINALQSHMLFAARAHTERMVLEAFVTGIDTCLDEAAAGVLSQLCDLYALASIEADRAWYLEHNRLTPARSKAVTAAVTDLCARLRPHALTLVEGLGVPEHWLRATMLAG